jgi:ubiquinone/menaquinone biosynthesis C-methylase UbiE
MSFYGKHILPRLLHLAMQNKEMTAHRRQLIPSARGKVLEIGIGSGLNLPFYAGVESVTGVDPSGELLAMAGKAARALPFPVELVDRGAEDLPFDARSFDTVVTTWTLCSIAQAPRALAEMRRVLRPNGELIFIEHGLSPDRRVSAWQQRLNPLWNAIAGGCNLNRRIDGLVRAAGFAIEQLETGYLVKGPKPLTYHFEGRAKRA